MRCKRLCMTLLPLLPPCAKRHCFGVILAVVCAALGYAGDGFRLGDVVGAGKLRVTLVLRTLLIWLEMEEMLGNMEKARKRAVGEVIFGERSYAYPTNQMSEGSLD